MNWKEMLVLSDEEKIEICEHCKSVDETSKRPLTCIHCGHLFNDFKKCGCEER